MPNEPAPRSHGVAPSNDALSAVKAAFPQTPEDFEADSRVAYDKLNGKWVLEDDNGDEWEFDQALAKWMPSLDEEAIAKQSEAYKVAGVDDTETNADKQKKKRQAQAEDNIEEVGGRMQKKVRKVEHPRPERKNSAVWVTGLPPDTNVDEVAKVFSIGGVFAETSDGAPRIKLYTDDEGNLKGEALVVYFKPESVNLAITLLDESDFRFGKEGSAGKIRVTEAESSFKKQKDAPPAPPNKRDKKATAKRLARLNNKLADWDDDDPSVLPETNSRYDKVVILKHMFTLQELDEDPTAILDIKEDIRDECGKLGEVTNVVLFDQEPEGIASVRFTEPEAAKACVRMMDGRWFGGTQVQAHIATGEEKYKKKKKNVQSDDEDEKEEERLNKFGDWLEEQKQQKQQDSGEQQDNGEQQKGGEPGSEATASNATVE
ncbi:hypothetical protein K490DRAFT_37953 [Saccharata proteae CBS 121410]|uniref:RRM domain-containing protein n=1 Tax=Saccharata proteae CBS 121410 TaxID=1314787 RepID=A0A6A5YAG7_9PEZI|nr:hypothetical protein K490DRAFT_37953 [Saccharata proteae CBS 121410]